MKKNLNKKLGKTLFTNRDTLCPCNPCPSHTA